MTILVKRHLKFFKKFQYDVWEYCLLSFFGKRYTRLRKKKVDKKKSFKTFFKKFYPYSGSTLRYKKVFYFFYSLALLYKEYKRKKQRRFIYRVDLIERDKPRKRVNERFSSLRIVKYFFAIMSYKQFRLLAKKIRRKEGFVGDLYLLALEGRLINILYRALFVENIFESFFLIKQSYVTVNKKVIKYPNYTINLFDIVSFLPLLKRRVFLFIYCRVCIEKQLLFGLLRFFFTSFIFLYFYLYKMPQDYDFPYRKGTDFKQPNRWPLDVYRASGYAL